MDTVNQSEPQELKKIVQLREDISEIQSLLETASREKVKQMLTMDIRRLETEITNLQQVLEHTGTQQQPSASKSAACTLSNVKITNYAWDQSEKFVKLYITLSNVESLPPESIKTEFSLNSVDLQVLGLNKRNQQLKITNLLKSISPRESHHKVKKDMVIIFLRKTSPENWSCVTALEQKAMDNKTPKFDESEDPNESLMNLMKKMYNEGDDEMKRTIAKAWTEARTKSTDHTMPNL